MKKQIAILFTCFSMLLGGCASMSQEKEQLAIVAKVVSVRNYEVMKKQPNGANALIGGLLGGVLGHQFGQGDGKTAATVVGTVGGMVAGANIDAKVVAVPMQEVVVQMPDKNNLELNVEIQDGKGFIAGQMVKITTSKDGKTAELKAM